MRKIRFLPVKLGLKYILDQKFHLKITYASFTEMQNRSIDTYYAWKTVKFQKNRNTAQAFARWLDPDIIMLIPRKGLCRRNGCPYGALNVLFYNYVLVLFTFTVHLSFENISILLVESIDPICTVLSDGLEELQISEFFRCTNQLCQVFDFLNHSTAFLATSAAKRANCPNFNLTPSICRR